MEGWSRLMTELDSYREMGESCAIEMIVEREQGVTSF
jgi:hypothetical protein